MNGEVSRKLQTINLKLFLTRNERSENVPLLFITKFIDKLNSIQNIRSSVIPQQSCTLYFELKKNRVFMVY